MRSFVKVIVAVQYLGDIGALKDVLVKEDIVKEKDAVFLLKQSGNTAAGYWKLAETDYVVKDNGNISVYKKERFEADFDEVILDGVKDNILAESKTLKGIEDIEVKEVKEVKPEVKTKGEDKPVKKEIDKK